MKIVQFGLPYSPNLGDGVISDCFAHGVRQLAPGAEVIAVDLSGREGFGSVVVANRSRALAVLRRLPRALRQRIVAAKLGPVLDRAEPAWRAALEGADLAVIGGGQLFSDADLNFPLKVARAADLARDAGVPLAVYAAGVAQNWSPRGHALYTSVYDADLRGVGLRDAPSIAAWHAQMGGEEPLPELTRDPGLLAASCYGPARPGTRTALCVAAPEILSYHAEGGRGAGHGLYERLARALLAEGHSLRLFSNGAEEDAAALDALAPGFKAEVASGAVEVAPRPTRPAELAALVADARAVVAHRLHACILAFSYGKPVVGLGWDRKVESFFSSVGATEAFSPAGETPADIAKRLGRALAHPLDEVRRGTAELEALDGIRRTLALARR